jgi:hypothetical protein
LELLQRHREAKTELRGELKEDPFSNQAWPVEPELGLYWVHVVERTSQEVKSGLITGVSKNGFSFGCQLVLEALEELRIAGMEVGYDLVATGFEEEEEEALELVVARLPVSSVGGM